LSGLQQAAALHAQPLRTKYNEAIARIGAAHEASRAIRRGITHESEGKMTTATKSNSLGMQFAWVPPGQSWLGGGGGKPGTKEFTLKDGLWCGIYPVTQAEWQAVMGNNPSMFKRSSRYPVEQVMHRAAEGFIEKLNKDYSDKDGLVYRLPTEDEWEYICRGGPISQDQSKYDFYFARSKMDLTPNPSNDLSSTQANFDGTAPAGSGTMGKRLNFPTDVGSYLPNPLGIYDLHGNVWEWTSSQDGSDRVRRGGSWFSQGAECTASYRGLLEPGRAYADLGFRLLAVPSGKEA
jgi:formylglycine-generating enzyme required for sulfatase activity